MKHLFSAITPAHRLTRGRAFSFTVVSILFSGISFSQTMLQQVAPETQGLSSGRLNHLDAKINQWIREDQLNGATMIILRNEKIVYNKAFGFANKQQNVPMRTDHIFRIASMTKPIISVAALMLYEEGKFLLTDPLSKYIPEFKNAVVIDTYNAADTTYTTVPAKREITIRDIFAHTSGIGYAQIGSEVANAIYFKNKINGGIGTPYSTLKDVITRLAKLPLLVQPGEEFYYGLNTDVLGYLIEVISGISLDKYLQQKIFAPLGMKDTYFFLPNEKQSRLVALYSQGNNSIRIQDSLISLHGTFSRDFPKTPNGTYFSGGAGLASTAYDYALFGQMLLNGGELSGKRILSPATIKLMTSNQIGDLLMWGDTNKTRRFGLGFGILTEYAERTTMIPAGSYGWDGMFASHYWTDPKSKMVVVFMRNIWPTDHWDYGDRIKPLIYQALLK
ncbi:MAG TPA: serine hydrolase domain-containing protein [Chitinophagaceae bacterium]|nr:serine hydrolase domain-containing protein [Chitinophagaceae bacterium]